SPPLLSHTASTHHHPPSHPLLLSHALSPHPPPARSPLFPYTTLFRSAVPGEVLGLEGDADLGLEYHRHGLGVGRDEEHRVLPERSEEHTSELQSRFDLVCRLLLEKKNNHVFLSTSLSLPTINTSARHH